MKSKTHQSPGPASAVSAPGVSSVLRARLAVVGAGTIGMRHISAIGACEHAELAGVVDSSKAKRAELAATGIRTFDCADDLLRKTLPDGVIVATPTGEHLETAMPAVSAGLPVLIEKPVASTLEAGRALGNAARKAGSRVLVGHHRRHHKQVAIAQKMIREGQLGDLVLVSGVWGIRKNPAYYEQEIRNTREAGPVLINFVHDIDLLRCLCGEVSRLSACFSNGPGAEAKEDAGVVAMQFRSGALGSYALSDRVASPWAWEYATGENRIVPAVGRNCLRLMGTKGSLEFPNLGHWTYEGGQGDWTKPIRHRRIECETIDPFMRQLEHFIDVIAGDAEPLIDIDDAMMSLRTTLAVFEAADTGNWVEI